MKVVILAGGFGTRLSEETHLKPKPMVEIGGKPILWHILKLYSYYGMNEFIICCGYKGYLIKEYFANYYLHTNDICIDIKNNNLEIIHSRNEPWKITLIDTGQTTMTGGRLLRVRDYLNNERFCFTYGDGIANINLDQLIDSHIKSYKLATLTAVQPPGRYGSLNLQENSVIKFKEKSIVDNSWINGGFFVLEPSIFDFIEDDSTVWEEEPLNQLSALMQLNAFKHEGFWQPMDTLRDKMLLEDLWLNKKAPWKIWKDI